MDWKASALARARWARMKANKLRFTISDLNYSLCNLGGYDDEYALLKETINTVDSIIEDLFELEGRLSHIE